MTPLSREKLKEVIDRSSRHASPFTKTIMPVAMDADELVAFINEKGKSAIVATLRRDGSPHTSWSPVACVGGELYLYADPRSACCRNLRRDPRISVAVVGGGAGAFLQGEAAEVGSVRDLVEGLVREIFEAVPNWIPRTSVTYPSLEECTASIFSIEMSRVISYKAKRPEPTASSTSPARTPP